MFRDIDPSAPLAEEKGSGDEGPKPERESGRPTSVCRAGQENTPDNEPNKHDRGNRLLMTVSHSAGKKRCQKVKSLTGVRVIRRPNEVYHPSSTSLNFPSTSSSAQTTDSSSPHPPFPTTKLPTDSSTCSVSEGSAERWFTNALIAF